MDNSISAAVGQRARRVRESYGWSEAVLSTECHAQGFKLSTQRIKAIEAGGRAVTVDELTALARGLQVSVLLLLVDEDENGPTIIWPRDS